MRKYHLSYDITDSTNADYNKYKEYLLYLLHLTNYESIQCYTKSTLIIKYNYEIQSIKIFNFLKKYLPKNIYYSISKISKKDDNDFFLSENEDFELNRNFQQELKNINWKNLKNTYSDLVDKF